jgi:CheY-like chemotaxis protein
MKVRATLRRFLMSPRIRVDTEVMDKQTILVVDDQPPTRRFLRRVLEREGYRVIEAEDDGSAWDAVQKHDAPICLAMIDVNLPGLKGRHVANNLRSFGPLPVVFMTGYSAADLIAEGSLEEGAPLIEKPFTVSGVMEVIIRLLTEQSQGVIHDELQPALLKRKKSKFKVQSSKWTVSSK